MENKFIEKLNQFAIKRVGLRNSSNKPYKVDADIVNDLHYIQSHSEADIEMLIESALEEFGVRKIASALREKSAMKTHVSGGINNDTTAK